MTKIDAIKKHKKPEKIDTSRKRVATIGLETKILMIIAVFSALAVIASFAMVIIPPSSNKKTSPSFLVESVPLSKVVIKPNARNIELMRLKFIGQADLINLKEIIFKKNAHSDDNVFRNFILFDQINKEELGRVEVPDKGDVKFDVDLSFKIDQPKLISLFVDVTREALDKDKIIFSHNPYLNLQVYTKKGDKFLKIKAMPQYNFYGRQIIIDNPEEEPTTVSMAK